MSGTSLRLSIEVGLDPGGAFAVVAEELASGLARLGLRFLADPQGLVTEGGVEVGRVEEALPLFAGEGPRFLFARKG